jgi:cytochrome c
VTLGKIATISCALTLTASFVLARFHPFGDAGLFKAGGGANPIMKGSTVPAEVRTILASKCADCHSMETRSPFYGHLAPLSWLMERDINRGRQAMNLALWDSYSADQKQTFAAKIVQETREHEMPLLQYRLIHWNSRVTGTEIRTLADWAHASSGPGSAPEQSDLQAAGGDPSRGQALFEKRCVGCHSLTANHEGPRLQGVFGRAAGSIADYAYSPSLKKSNVTWDETTLDKWLTDPDAFVPGNNMDFLVSKPQERKDLIAYFRKTSGK